MRDHPILAMRDPPPEIDVTRPALPKRDRPTSNPGGCECLTCGAIFIGGPDHTACAVCEALPKREPSWNEYMCIEPIAEGLTEPAAPTPNVSGESAQASHTDCAPSVAADQFRAGDRVMLWHCGKVVGPRIFMSYDGKGIRYRNLPGDALLACMPLKGWLTDAACISRPTDAELALHWPEVLP